MYKDNQFMHNRFGYAYAQYINARFEELMTGREVLYKPTNKEVLFREDYLKEGKVRLDNEIPKEELEIMARERGFECFGYVGVSNVEAARFINELNENKKFKNAYLNELQKVYNRDFVKMALDDIKNEELKIAQQEEAAVKTIQSFLKTRRRL